MKKGVIADRRFLAFIIIFLTALPPLAHAQVVIDEVMYNPLGTDTGREWIELYNAGAADVTMVAGSGKGSWRISDGSNHMLVDPTSGVGRGPLTIPAGGYLVIASDPAEFISGEYAGGSYSVIKSSISLNNTGTTVSVLDGTGATLDSFAYTSDMGGNNDGTSLQKNNGSWIAALPTPGATNATTPYTPASGDSSSATSSQTSDQSTSTPASVPVATISSYVAPPVPTLFADAGEDRTVIVGADTEFDGRAYDRQQEPVDTVRFNWNFGDGTIAEGPAVLHHFEYPGRYAVILNIAHDLTAVSDRVVVTAEPAKLAFFANSDGSVSIENDAGRDLDLSSWIIKSLGREFVLPDHSIILAGGTMRISQKTLDFWSAAQTELEYPNGVTALHAGEHTESATVSPDTNAVPDAVSKSDPPIVAPATSPAPPTPVAPAVSSENIEATAVQGNSPDAPANDTDVSTTSTTSPQVAAAGGTMAGGAYWWLGALVLSLCAGVAVFAAKRMKKGEWDIIEE